MSDIYTVFRRNDGYVGAIASSTPEIGRDRLRPYGTTSFEILLQTDDWIGEARPLIERERKS